ncbi:hypothetical protein HKX48_007641 [Thoreauomyces humboldtii]|nr:hypothetical protein HKX48_007641 [Thoreauomyces humboldtii]
MPSTGPNNLPDLFDTWAARNCPSDTALRQRADVLRERVQQIVDPMPGLNNVELRGSLWKKTDGPGSDIDLVIQVKRSATATRRQRQMVLNELVHREIALPGQSATTAIQCPLKEGNSVDISFSASTYGPGSIPNTPGTKEQFKRHPVLAAAVRVLKCLTKELRLPKASGTALEQAVLCSNLQDGTNPPKTVYVAVMATLRNFEQFQHNAQGLIAYLNRKKFDASAPSTMQKEIRA